MTTPYSMKDILKFRKAAYLAARVSGETEIETLQVLATDRKPLSFNFNPRDWQQIGKHFKPFLPGLTSKAMKEIYQQFLNERREIWEKRIELEPESSEVERLSPLGKQAYRHFAKYVWEKRGGFVSVKGHFGCTITTNLRGKKFLRISIAD